MPIERSVGASGGGGGGVSSVTAGDTSIVIGGTAANPTVETADLATIATDHATAGDVSLNGHKGTNVANGTVATDAAAFGQIPTALPPNGTAGGDLSGTYPNPKVAKITETSGPTDLTIGTIADGQFLKRSGATLVSGAPVASVAATDTSIVVAGTGTAPTIATGTLDVIAADHPPAADWSNNSHKITSVTNGSSAQDAATFVQIPPLTKGGTILNPSGALNVITWYAPAACTVLAVKGYVSGATGSTVNARKNGTSTHLSSNLTLGSADTWLDGGAVQNTGYSIGDKLEIMIVSVSGSPTQIAVQVDYSVP